MAFLPGCSRTPRGKSQPKELVLALAPQRTPGTVSYSPLPSQGNSPASQQLPFARCSS